MQAVAIGEFVGLGRRRRGLDLQVREHRGIGLVVPRLIPRGGRGCKRDDTATGEAKRKNGTLFTEVPLCGVRCLAGSDGEG